MGKVVKVTEENEKMTLRYTKKFDYWSLLGALLGISIYVVLMLFFEEVSIDSLIDIFLNISFGKVLLFITIGGGAILAPFWLLQQREIKLAIDEKFIIVEYPLTNKNSEKIIQKIFVNEDIKRIYYLNSNKDQNSANYNRYELWIEDFQGKETKILGKDEGFIVKDEEDIIEAINEIRDFLRKQKRLKPKKEVIQKVISTPKVKVVRSINSKVITPPRKVDKEQDTAKLKIQDLREGVLFDFHNENWEVIHQIQYDWKLENTDTLYQIKNQRNQISLLFVVQNMAVYTAWIEERVPQYELMDNQLDKISESLPRKFTFRESVFLKEHFNTGHEFVSKSKNGVKIKQWKYLSEDRKESLRILEHEDKDTFVFWGEKIEEFEFSNILSS